MRAIAIVAVVFAHSISLLRPMGKLPQIGEGILFVINHTINLAAMGVEVFFVLSGFLIGNILIRTFVQTDFSFAEVKKFWVRRWFRTLPAYWLIFTVNLVVFQVVKLNDVHATDFLGYFFLENLWSPNILSFFTEAWSLAAEEWFYLILPIVMWLSAAIVKPKDKEKFLLKVIIGYMVGFLFIRFLNSFHDPHWYDPDDSIRKVVLYRLDASIYGVMIAFLNFFRLQWLGRVKNKLMVIGMTLIVILYYLLTKYDLAFVQQKNLKLRFICDVFLYTVLPLVFSLVLPYANSVKTMKSKRFSSIVQHISKISYSMYLVHFSLLLVPFFLRIKTDKPETLVWWYLLYWIIVIGLSSVLYKFFEYPLMQLRERVK